MQRRTFLKLGALSTPAIVGVRPALFEPCALPEPVGAPAEVARDEDFWFEVQQAFTVDRSLINFNNGGVSPSPAVVQESLARHLAQSNGSPAQQMFQVQPQKKETVRTALARLFGCDAEEIAITRNSSEGLQTCQLGFDLARGDEVLTTTQDYGRMLRTWDQRARRDGIVVKKITVPVPCEDPDEIVRRFENALTERTRVILMCHVINLTGQILPVNAVVRMAREHGIPVIVDGAHSFAHFPFVHADLDCDYYATSLHKWLFAPFGTGMLFVRRDKIEGLWPLMAADETQSDDIRKFEEIGTHPIANFLAIADAITFHSSLGVERKAARLRFLRDRWAKRVAGHDSVRLNTSLEPEFSCGIANVAVDGIAPADLADHLWEKHRIFVAAIGHEECAGIRVSPSVYSTLDEVDLFAEALLDVARNGV